MPARTVVFDSIRKHDGTQMRNLLPGGIFVMIFCGRFVVFTSFKNWRRLPSILPTFF